ncbi:hypothetical protein EGW08_023521, partial [Elysia chlorotica]
MSGPKRSRREGLFSVYVGNLHPDITEEYISELFCKCGKIKDIIIMEQKESRASKFGFVRYGCQEDAVQAIKELNGWRVKSQKLIVDLARETYVKIKKAEPKQHMSVASLQVPDSLLPVVNHFDSLKNMVRVKEACVRINSEAFSHLGKFYMSKSQKVPEVG